MAKGERTRLGPMLVADGRAIAPCVRVSALSWRASVAYVERVASPFVGGSGSASAAGICAFTLLDTQNIGRLPGQMLPPINADELPGDRLRLEKIAESGADIVFVRAAV